MSICKCMMCFHNDKTLVSIVFLNMHFPLVIISLHLSNFQLNEIIHQIIIVLDLPFHRFNKTLSILWFTFRYPKHETTKEFQIWITSWHMFDASFINNLFHFLKFNLFTFEVDDKVLTCFMLVVLKQKVPHSWDFYRKYPKNFSKGNKE